ncbi:MAG: hypothetical protein ACKOGA_20685, partial [Planctomycetaceae bacterium]
MSAAHGIDEAHAGAIGDVGQAGFGRLHARIPPAKGNPVEERVEVGSTVPRLDEGFLRGPLGEWASSSIG